MESSGLEKLASEVFAVEYGLPDVTVRAISTKSFNSFFEVTASQRSILRLGDVLRIHVDGIESIEADWLDALHGDGFTVPTTIRASNGAAAVEFGGRVCTQFRWLDGDAPTRDEAIARAAGKLLAELHEQASTYAPGDLPAGIMANRPTYFPQHDLVCGHDQLLGEAYVRCQVELNSLWLSPPHTPHLLHGDFGFGNLLQRESEVRALDFQDLLLGFDVQDLGITYADFMRFQPELWKPFRAGYSSVRPWPAAFDDLSEMFVAARSLNLINLGLCLRRPGIEEHLARHHRIVSQWMRR